MRNKKIEAYCYYKQQYPGTVVFFRVENNYEIYQEDARKIGEILGLDVEKSMQGQESVVIARLPIETEYEHVSKLTSIAIKMISHRNEKGEFDVPDVDELQIDKEIDY
jgi:DNA mismatch repair ATPase MutS